MARSLMFGAALLAAALPLSLSAQDGKASKKIYDETADARVELAKACEKAGRDNKRVLVMFGGNWCGWCHKLHAVFEQDAKVRRTLSYEYEVLLVDIGRWDKHKDLAEELGANLEQGVPFLTIVDPAGQPVANQETGSLESGSNHDPAAVLAFLEKHKPDPLHARAVLKLAQKQATETGKKLFIHLGAPWCGYCHMLEDWMVRPEIAPVLARDYLDVKIDTYRMIDGAELAAELREGKGGGIPWIVITDAELHPEITSDGDEGNTGFPIADHEIAHFAHMLATTRVNMTEDDVAMLRKSLEDNAAEIMARRKKAAEERARQQAEEAAKAGGGK